MSAFTSLLTAALLQPSEPPEPTATAEPSTVAEPTDPAAPVVEPLPAPAPAPVAAPAPAPAPVAAPAPSAAPAAATPPAPAPPPDSPFNRRGFILRAAVGIANCLGDFCDDDEIRTKIGPGALFELGYRPIEQISFGVGVQASTLKIDVDTDPGVNVDARAIMVSPLGFFFVHPVKNSRLDPYAGVGVGWSMIRESFESESETDTPDFEGAPSDSDTTTYTLKRGTARLTAGLDVYVSERVALGPRFDIFLGFGGEVCVDDGMDEECDDVDDAFDNDEEEELPRNWMFGLNLSATF